MLELATPELVKLEFCTNPIELKANDTRLT